MKQLRIIENDLVPVYTTSTGEKVVYGTELHKVLEVKSNYREWVSQRFLDIEAMEREDFESVEIPTLAGGTPRKEHIICLDSAKEMAMLELGPNTIIVLEIFDEAATKTKGLALKGWLEKLLPLKIGNIVVDFRRITRFACPFFNYSFAALALVYGFDAVRAIQIKNISRVGRATFQASMQNAEMVSRYPGHIMEPNQILDDAPKKVMM